MTTKNREGRMARDDKNRPTPSSDNNGANITEQMRALVTVLHQELEEKTPLGLALIETDRTDILVETVWNQLGRETG